jgi:hypothetical protein
MLLPSGITPYPNPLPDGHAYRIPAPWGYLNVLCGATDGSSGLRTINAKDCDGTATTTAPRAPANLSVP